jgi:NDP-sugar pyrophosphorylase family protein
MLSLVQTPHYEIVLKELNYSFGDIYIFDNYVVSEIKEGVDFSWEHHAKKIVSDITDYLGTDREDIIYISHRIHSYSVVPMDWLKFFKNSFSLKAYGVISYKNSNVSNSKVESLFFNKKIQRFDSLDSAIKWAKQATKTSKRLV